MSRYIFITSYFLFLFIMAYYIYCSISHLMNKRNKKLLYLLYAFILGIILFQLNFRLNENFSQSQWLSPLANIIYVSMGFLGTLLVFLIFKDLVKLLSKLTKQTSKINTRRRDFFKTSALWGIGGTGTLISSVGFYQAQIPNMETIQVSLPRLPQAFDGTTIVQISDLHIGPTIGRKYTEEVVEKTNDEQPDFIAVTGDLIDGRVKHLKEKTAPLKNLKAKYGVFYVTGNHEFYWNAEEWVSYLENELNMKALRNTHVVFERENQRFILAGVEDMTLKSDPIKASKGSLQDDFKLLLAHQPRSCYKAKEAGFDYMICGHTHGGQYYPMAWLVYLFQPYVRGLHNHEGMQLYVSKGAGYWGPPNRFGVKNEITKHILRSAPYL